MKQQNVNQTADLVSLIRKPKSFVGDMNQLGISGLAGSRDSHDILAEVVIRQAGQRRRKNCPEHENQFLITEW